MEAKAIAKYVRMSPRKVRHVIDLIRGKDLAEALAILRFTPNIASEPIRKVVESAAANAENNHNMVRDALYVSSAFVDGGPSMRRMRPGSIGRGGVIKRRMSHITVGVSEREELKARRVEGRSRRAARSGPGAPETRAKAPAPKAEQVEKQAPKPRQAEKPAAQAAASEKKSVTRAAPKRAAQGTQE